MGGSVYAIFLTKVKITIALDSYPTEAFNFVGVIQRSCLDFISSLVEKAFCVDLHSRFAADSGLFARKERAKMPKRGSNKQKSIFLNLLAVKSKQLLIAQ